MVYLFKNRTLEFDVGNKNFTELCANFNETEFEKAQNDILINEINKNLEDNEVAEETKESEPISDAQVQDGTTTSATSATSSTTTELSIEEKQLDIATTTSASETLSSTSLTTTSSAEEGNLPVDNRLLYLYCQLEGKILSLLENIANFRIHA